jgi:hypothetical protein
MSLVICMLNNGAEYLNKDESSTIQVILTDRINAINKMSDKISFHTQINNLITTLHTYLAGALSASISSNSA